MGPYRKDFFFHFLWDLFTNCKVFQIVLVCFSVCSAFILLAGQEWLKNATKSVLSKVRLKNESNKYFLLCLYFTIQYNRQQQLVSILNLNLIVHYLRYLIISKNILSYK